jgi:type IV pilus assembly protein PilA
MPKALTVRHRNYRGFTLVELLVVVLILGVLMAVALPLYLSAVTSAETKTCRANMETIAGAVQAYRVRNQSATLASVAALAVTPTNFGDLQGTPKCPNSGTYTLSADTPNNGIIVTCSATGHGTYEIGINSN